MVQLELPEILSPGTRFKYKDIIAVIVEYRGDLDSYLVKLGDFRFWVPLDRFRNGEAVIKF